MVLAIIIFVTNVPDLGLVLKVMANPNPDKLMTMKEKEDIEIIQEDTESEFNELGKSVEMADVTDLGKEDESESAGNEVMQSETEINNTVSEGSNFIDENHSDYKKTVFPEDMVYDEIIDGDTVLSNGEVIADKKILYQGNVIIDSNIEFKNCNKNYRKHDNSNRISKFL